MKLNIACRETGGQVTVEVDDDKKLLPFFEKRIGAEVPADSLGDEFKGYILKITGGNDKQGFPMLQGVLTNQRVRLLFREGMKCYRPRRTGEKRRKSVRGCIVSPDLSVINAVVSRKGDNEISKLTDINRPRRLGPKRANKIRKMFNLTKDVDVRPFVPRRQIEGTKKTKAPKVQRLVTASRLQRKRRFKRQLKLRHEKVNEMREEYKHLTEEYLRQKRAEQLAKKQKKSSNVATTAAKKQKESSNVATESSNVETTAAK